MVKQKAKGVAIQSACTKKPTIGSGKKLRKKRRRASKPEAATTSRPPSWSSAKAAKSSNAAKQRRVKQRHSNDSDGAVSGTASSDCDVNDDSGLEVDATEYTQELQKFLASHGKAHISIIGRQVPKPEGLRLGVFLVKHADKFVVDARNGCVSLR
mmetsp:Transcript_134542/g.268523  ORF Transcript_134542/g.268523 Transcript_134542/m.268523 type:complete len:155 (-) Transcript_134542:32-496(-)